MKSLLKYQLCLLILLLTYAAGRSAPRTAATRVLLTNFIYSSTCLNDSISFRITDDIDEIDSVKWNFGDPASLGLDSTNREQGAGHVYRAGGTYTVTLRAYRAGVEDITTQTITIVQKKIVNMPPDITLCDSTAFAINVIVDPSTPLTGMEVITWQDTIPGTLSFNVTEMGTYRIKFDGCQPDDSTNVFYSPVPDFDLGADLNLCTDEIITLDATAQNADYLWSNGETTPTITVMNNMSGTYMVEATVTGCGVYRDTITVNFSGMPQPFSLGPDTLLCAGETIRLIANVPSATGAVRWSNGVRNINYIDVSTRNNYWALVTTNTALGTCDVIDTIAVNYNPLRDVNLGNDTTVCRGEELVLTANYGTGSYLWQDGSKQATFYVDSPGYYYVRAQIGRCVSTDTIRVNYDDTLRVNLGPDTLICRLDRFILYPNGAGTNYKWQDSSTVASFTVTAPGIYAIVADNTCNRSTDSVEVNMQQCDCTVFFPTGFSPNNDGTNDHFRPVYRCLAQDYKLWIYNRWGELMFYTTDPTVSWTGSLNGKPCTTGTYVWIADYKDSTTGKQYNQRGTVTLIR
ncbi:gliding motility-associated C-terminal domain-containing protein [uncultured Chitinophaga sp.]|uniref:T9SS type B sorting domain-containing protein n=1 Tax=uncultured Chitinophaga sp. TaxID=339340 RepID=UPI0025D845E5|nr:gliding motility-associated C-terminal domain-containing protein [uncultured Chitinophaga sp.]